MKYVLFKFFTITYGCILSAGSVVNHYSVCCEGVHVDCSATVSGNTLVPAEAKIHSETVFKNDDVNAYSLFVNSKKE